MIRFEIENSSLSEEQVKEILEHLEKNKYKLDFFGVKEDINIKIKVFDTKKEWDEDYSKDSEEKPQPWMVGGFGNGIIKIVSYIYPKRSIRNTFKLF